MWLLNNEAALVILQLLKLFTLANTQQLLLKFPQLEFQIYLPLLSSSVE